MGQAFEAYQGRRRSEFRMGCTGILLIFALLVFFGTVIGSMF